MVLSFLFLTAATSSVAAATDRKAVMREIRAEKQFPPTGQLITVNDRIVHAHVEGSGPDLVLLHGASGNTREFTFRLVARLRERYRVIAFDRPGLGWSQGLGEETVDPRAQARQLIAACSKLGVHNPIVLGQSYGGAVALAWALEPEAKPAALVIVAGASNPWEGGLGAWYRITSSGLGSRAVIPLVTAFATRGRAIATIAEIFAPEPIPEGYPDYIGVALTLRRKTMRNNVRQVNGLLPHVRAMSERYPELRLPVEIVHGTEDTIVPLKIHSIPLARQIPSARLVTIPGAGHMPHHTHPDEVIAAIDRARVRAGLHRPR